MDRIFRLGIYLHEKKPEFRSHFYRCRQLLKQKTQEVYNFEEFRGHKSLVQLLAQYAPLEPEDLNESSDKRILKSWNLRYPRDPKFFQMLLSQMDVWKDFHNQILLKFLESEAGLSWIKSRKKIKRKAYFELDTFYKRTKSSALKNEIQVRNLLRKHPLLRLEDLRKLSVRNAQVILANFPFLEKHRTEFLHKLKGSTR